VKFLQDLSIRSKLVLLSLTPLTGLLYYLQINVRKEQADQKIAGRVIRDVQQIQVISSLIHEFQKERTGRSDGSTGTWS
jgi:hypothetical protein